MAERGPSDTPAAGGEQAEAPAPRPGPKVPGAAAGKHPRASTSKAEGPEGGQGGALVQSDDDDAALGPDDSDFDSSDVDAVLMSVDQVEQCEAGDMAKRWSLRRATKRKKLRAKGVREDGEGDAEESATGGGRAPKRIRRDGWCSVAEDVRSSLAKGQAAYAAGDFDQAIAEMRTVIQKQAGLPEPYHVLTLVYRERGEERKSLDCLLMAAMLTTGPDARAVWRRVASMSRDQWRATQLPNLLTQACWAYNRSLKGRGVKTEEDWESLWELSQLYFQRGNFDQGLMALYSLYGETGDSAIACEVAKKLVSRHRWKECLEILESCVEKGRREQPPCVNVNALNMLCEVLMEVRDFEKCVSLLLDLFQMRGCRPAQDIGMARASIAGAASSSSAPVESMALVVSAADVSTLVANLRSRPVDLVAKLACAICRLQKSGVEEPEPLCAAAIEVVMSHSPESYHDLHVQLADALLEDAHFEGKSKSSCRWPRRSHLGMWAARQALAILDVLADSGVVEEDLRERRAMCLWRTGQVEDAALLLEDILSEPGAGGRSELDIRELRVRAAEAWIEQGCMERADKCLEMLSYQDLQRSGALPPAMSPQQRRERYEELSRLLDAIAAGTGPAMDEEQAHSLFDRFRQLVLDCELDYHRLARYTANAAAAAGEGQQEEEPEGQGPVEYDTPDPSATSEPPAPAADRGAQVDTQGVAGEDDAGKVADEKAIVTFSGPKVHRRKPSEVTPLQVPSVFFRTKRRHLGLETVEDMFGFEAYLAFVLKGVELLRPNAGAKAKGVQRHVHMLDLVRAVELCEMILSNRRLVALRNQVKRHYLRTLAQKSVTLAFAARLWRVVFKHLRGMANEDANDDVIALFVRILFTHAEVEFLGGRGQKSENTSWDRFKPFSANSQRGTYAASVTDVRSWALRQLLRRPHSFGLTLLAGHFCVLASKYPLAVAEYCRAHRLAPFDPLTSLCTGVTYISFSMSRTAVHRHDLILKGFAFIQRYKSLRLDGCDKGAETTDGDVQSGQIAVKAVAAGKVMEDDDEPLRVLARQAEASYNMGRAFHQLSINYLAVEAYQKALSFFEKFAGTGSPCGTIGPDGVARGRADLVVLQRSCAYNLAAIYRAQGSEELANATLWRYIVF